VVGTFKSGTLHESGVLTDLATLQSALQRPAVHSVTVLLESPAAFDEFKTALTTNPTLNVDVVREPEFFARRAEELDGLMFLVTYVVGAIMAVGAFFGALYWARAFALPMLGDIDHRLLWPDFKAVWPSLAPGFTASPAGTVEAFTTMGPWPIPTLNTAILLSSGGTITIAHHALLAGHRAKTIFWMWITVALGITFISFQAYEYIHAYTELNLKLSSGIYGSTFFMLTGFHGFHVFVGMLMLTFITLRLMKGHFTPQRHFGFEGAAWYWHFVDVVWVVLFLTIYVIK